MKTVKLENLSPTEKIAIERKAKMMGITPQELIDRKISRFVKLGFA